MRDEDKGKGEENVDAEGDAAIEAGCEGEKEKEEFDVSTFAGKVLFLEKSLVDLEKEKIDSLLSVLSVCCVFIQSHFGDRSGVVPKQKRKKSFLSTRFGTSSSESGLR